MSWIFAGMRPYQCRVCWYLVAHGPLSIAKVGWNAQLALLANTAHQCHSRLPSHTGEGDCQVDRNNALKPPAGSGRMAVCVWPGVQLSAAHPRHVHFHHHRRAQQCAWLC